jgi:hypothetical protein
VINRDGRSAQRSYKVCGSFQEDERQGAASRNCVDCGWQSCAPFQEPSVEEKMPSQVQDSTPPNYLKRLS